MELGEQVVALELDAVVEAGHHQERQQGRGDGAADDGHRHGAVKLAAFAHADGHGQHARDQREGGHQDRAQAFAPGVHERFFAVHALRLFGARGVEQQDRVLGHQAHQHDHANEAHQVERAARQQQGQHHTNQRQRQRQHHGQWRGERAELHHQDQVHQRDARDQRDAHVAKHFFLVLGRPSQFDAVAGWEVHFAGDLHCVGCDLAAGAPLRIGRHRDGAFAIGMLDARRPLPQGDLGDLGQWHDGVGARHRDGQALDVARIGAVFGGQAHGHVARFACGVDPVADLDARKGHTQRVGGVSGRDAQRVGQAAVQLDAQLVLRVLLRQADVDSAGHFAQTRHEVVGDLEQLARVGARELDLHRFGRAIAQVVQHGELGTHQHAGARAQFCANLLRRALAFGALADVDIDAATTRVDVAVGRLGFGHRARQGGGGIEFEAGVFEAAAGRGAHIDGQGVAIGGGQETGAAKFGLQTQRCHQADERKQGHRRAVVQRPGDHAAIAVGLVVKPGVEACQPQADATLGHFVVAGWVAPVGRQHGVERERDQQAHQHRRHHREAKGPKPFARHAGHEGHRNEHRHDGEGGGGHGQTDFSGALQSRFTTAKPAFHEAHDVLAHHDGVVDQHANGQRQTQ